MKGTIKKLVILALVTFSSIHFQCTGNTQEKKASDRPVLLTINLGEASAYTIAEVFSSIDYLILTEEEYVIGNLKQLLVSDDYLFVVDDMNNVLLKFDKAGKFLMVLKGGGEGPEEVDEITWVSLDDQNKELYIYSEPEGKVSKFNFDFEHEGSMSRRMFVHSFEYIGDGKLLLFSNDTRQSDIDHNLTIVNWKGDKLAEFLPIDARYERLSQDLSGYLSWFDGGVDVFLSYRNGVFHLKNGHIEHKYQIDFGTSNIRPEEVSGRFVEEIIDKLKTEEKYMIENLKETPSHIYFEANNFKNYLQVYWDKGSNKAKVVKSFFFEEQLFAVPVAIWGDDKIVSFLGSEYPSLLSAQIDAAKRDRLNDKVRSWLTGETSGALLAIGQLKNW